MKHIKPFNEDFDYDEEDDFIDDDNDGDDNEDNYDFDVRVKDIIKYLQTLNPETKVELYHDGWNPQGIHFNNAMECIESRGLFEVWQDRGEEFLTINN